MTRATVAPVRSERKLATPGFLIERTLPGEVRVSAQLFALLEYRARLGRRAGGATLLPPESTASMAQALGRSLRTVRRALQDLVARRQVTRERGGARGYPSLLLSDAVVLARRANAMGSIRFGLAQLAGGAGKTSAQRALEAVCREFHTLSTASAARLARVARGTAGALRRLDLHPFAAKNGHVHEVQELSEEAGDARRAHDVQVLVDLLVAHARPPYAPPASPAQVLAALAGAEPPAALAGRARALAWFDELDRADVHAGPRWEHTRWALAVALARTGSAFATFRRHARRILADRSVRRPGALLARWLVERSLLGTAAGQAILQDLVHRRCPGWQPLAACLYRRAALRSPA